ncbi:MAG TPA: KpsF/GutQ family sugar-phosphate isomerase [Candidatus Kapabacteria bacterium]|nr:KpsF/GutQ family sugar-phosphate isomerase [Candidatus Kapabacteria bacterium]
MTAQQKIIAAGKRVVDIETIASAALAKRIDSHFARAVQMMLKCPGRVIVTGMGKSGNIAQKFVATLNSTGTPAVFLHPSDAMHGDVGMVQKKDIVVAISKSGDTPEIAQLIPLLRRLPVKMIAIVGKKNSLLAHAAAVALDASVAQEACPNNLAPTASTTAALVMCDALAVALLEQKNFSASNFANVHPGGQLGRRLLLKVEEIMTRGRAVPIVKLDSPIQKTILEISSKRLGATCVVNGGGKLAGIVTDGDLRRFMEHTTNFTGLTARDLMSKSPKTISQDVLAQAALEKMESHNIMQLIVTDQKQRPIGMVHLHELVKAGYATSLSLENE